MFLENYPWAKAIGDQVIFLISPDGHVRWGLGPFGEGRNAFYLPGFFGGNPGMLRPSKIIEFSLNDLKLKFQALKKPHWIEPEFKSFETQVLSVQNLFEQTELKKVLPVVRWKTDWVPDSEDLFLLLENLFLFSQKNLSKQKAYTYGYWNKGEGFIGRTPELLFEVENQKLKTMALAGTAWAGSGKDLLNDKKELAEHEWVVKEILAKLGEVGKFAASALQVKSAGTVEHLFTHIEGLLQKNTNLEELCQLLHPTPALGGYPQALALEWLKRQPEAQWRGPFGGPLGYEDGSGKMECVVLIRGLFWNRQGSFIPAGCGIVADSKVESEWMELKKKKDSVEAMLGWDT